jgi:hypothetical protein
VVSHSSEWLSCTGCGEIFPFSNAYVFQYTDLPAASSIDAMEGHCWPVLAIPCWCIDCNRPAYAERIPKLDELLKAAAVRRIPEGNRRHEIDDELLSLDSELLKHFVSQFLSRVAQPRCLLCGSFHFVPVERWSSRTRLKHEACGSELKAHWVIQGSIGRREFRYYTPEGVLLCSFSAVA